MKHPDISLEVADIFNDYGHLLPALSKEKMKVIQAIRRCRTSDLGGHKSECNFCEYEKYSYNSCRNRHCPKCGFIARQKWIAKRSEELIDCQYFHVVFTLPAKLRDLILRNKKVCYSILFKASAETLKEVARNSKYLGADIGFIGVLHTWSQSLIDHPHIHYLIPGGGLRGKEWVGTSKDFFLPVKVLSKVFMGKFLEAIEQSFHDGELKFHGKIDYLSHFANFKELLMSCTEKSFIVYAKKPFLGPKQVINYLGGYTHRIAISNYRLIKVEKGKVHFKVRDKSNPENSKVMILDVVEFMRRFLLHVLPNAFVRIRHFGILGNRYKKVKIDLIRNFLGVSTKVKKDIEVTWRELMKSLVGVDVDICPRCRDGTLEKSSLIKSIFDSS